MLHDSDQLDDRHWPEPAVPNWQQAMEFLAAANEVGNTLGWRRPTAEEAQAMSEAADACMRASASDTPTIPGML